jgi:hypothetical protein
LSVTTLTGLLFILVPLAFNTTFFLLQRAFEYPDILRRPADYVLRRFQAGGRPLRQLWYAFALSSLLFTPVPILAHLLFEPNAPWFLTVGTAIGVLAGLVQFLGLIRWSFLVPTLVEMYTDAKASQATRDSVVVTFQAFHRYAGVAIGEHLGYILTSAWTILFCLAIIEGGVDTLLGWLGLIPGVGILVGVLEEAGFKPASVINAISYILWSLWLIAFGITLLVG